MPVIRRVIKFAHNGAIVLVQDLDVNAALPLKSADGCSSGQGVEKPFVSGQANRGGSALGATERQKKTNTCRDRSESDCFAEHNFAQVRVPLGSQIWQADGLPGYRIYLLREFPENHRNFTGASPELMFEWVIDPSGRIM